MNTTEVLQPNLFPFPFQHHLIFCCVALVFFVFLYMKYKKPHQLIMAIAIPFSLVLWISTSRVLFYAVGIIEVILLITALVLNIIHRKKHPELYEEKKDNEDKEKPE
ncbi:MAG: hypothetical protein SPE43_09970 [Ruminococcus sp.]|nr:hypothetical protein [Ruminococcus sp.]